MKFSDTDVFRVERKTPEPVDARSGDAIFTLRGNHDYMYDDIPATNRKENSGLACAKKEGGRFYVRINEHAAPPPPLDTTHVNTAGRIRNGLPTWKYLKVSYSTFAHYAHFLKTRNLAFLTLARRDIGSGTN